MKRLDIALALAGPAILGVWAWLTWPAHVTAVGIAFITAPLYVAVVLVFHRQDADREWMRLMREWGEAVEAEMRALKGDTDALFNAAHDHGDRPEPLPGDLPTSPALDVAGEAARRVLEETPTEPTRQMQTVHREMGGHTFEFRE